MCNAGLLENVIPQITPFYPNHWQKPADVYHLNYRVLKTLRTHDIVPVMPFMIPKIESFISLSTTKTQATRGGN